MILRLSSSSINTVDLNNTYYRASNYYCSSTNIRSIGNVQPLSLTVDIHRHHHHYRLHHNRLLYHRLHHHHHHYSHCNQHQFTVYPTIILLLCGIAYTLTLFFAFTTHVCSYRHIATLLQPFSSRSYYYHYL